MGLDTVIVAFFVVGTIVVAAGSLTMGASNFIECSYDGFKETSQTTMERLHTDIKIQSVRFDLETKNIYLTVQNTGEIKLDNFKLWDIILVKNGQVSYLNKDEDYSISFSGDIINPGILDPQENLEIRLFSQFDPGEDIIIKISTENGIVSSIHHVVGQ
ncbi:MAG: flagellar protein FlaF [Methanosarcina sp.]